MNGTNRTVCLALCFIVLVAGVSFAHNPDGTLTESELASIALEQVTIAAMNRTISWSLAQVPINWLVIWFAQIVIEEARSEIEEIENHT